LSLKNIYQNFRYIIIGRKFKGITAAQRKLPDFLVIGGKRCGTTTLFEFLRQHQMIAEPVIDHMGFFDDNYSIGINYYKSFFPIKTEETAKKLDYDVTTSYLTSPFVAERVAKEIPNVKIIVLLRNPTSRAWSDYNASQKKDASEEEFQTYIDDELQELEASDFEEKVSKNDYNMSEPFSNFIKKGLYSVYLKKWLKLFPRKNFLFISTESFSNDENKVFKQIFDFLGLSNFEIHKLQRMSKGNYEKLNPKIKNKLDLFFAPHNDELFKLINEKYDW
jgi:hypothetical protein|tara:strand:+ start:507 stop:1337 length:831 start_codon:yes stop_codon:yes gene_type:complete